MIRPIDIRLNAAHPELPLAEAVTFTGAPSTVLIRGVPPNCGRWAITAVSVAATYPDGSTTTRAAVQSANGVWVATLPATATSGRTANGLRVMADGIDENGDAVTGYILGVADFAVASLGVTPAPEPGETSWQMLYFDEVPGTLRKGDVAKVDGVLKRYNGAAWEPFAGDIPAPSTATPAMDGTGAAGSSAAFARGDHVHPTDTSRMAATATGADIPLNPSAGALDMNSAVNLLATQVDGAQTTANDAGAAATAANNKIDAHIANTTIHVTAAEKSTWNGKQNALTQTQLDNIAAVPNKADINEIAWSFSDEGGIVYDVGDIVSYGGSFWKCIASYTPQQGAITPDVDSTHWQYCMPCDEISALSREKANRADLRYDRITITTGQLQDRSEQKVTLNAATTTLTLPALTDLSGKVSDFGIDVVNGYEVSGTPTAASFSLAGTIGTDYNLIVPEGDDWSEMSALAAGEMAVYYFTLSAFQINDKPTWEVMKKVVELVPVPVAP